MVRNPSPYSLSLAYANPHPPPRRARPAPSQRPRPRIRPTVIFWMVVAAIAWLLLGCSGLVWTIAFTVGPQPLTIALLVWVLAFVGPSVIATVVAYRLDEEQQASGAPGDD